jgi:hypothetical protein
MPQQEVHQCLANATDHDPSAAIPPDGEPKKYSEKALGGIPSCQREDRQSEERYKINGENKEDVRRAEGVGNQVQLHSGRINPAIRPVRLLLPAEARQYNDHQHG